MIGIEARGFIFAAPVAYRIGAGFVPVRKAGKLPWAVVREEYELEYGTDKLEIHRDAIHPGERVLIVDDVLATGGTAAATARLVETLGGVVAGLGFVIELDVLGGRAQVGERTVRSLLQLLRPVDHGRPSTGSCPGGGSTSRSPTELTPLLASYRRRHPKALGGHDQPGLRVSPPRPTAPDARESARPTSPIRWRWPRSCADLGLDDVTVAAALLHDAVEDTEITVDDVERDFGAEVAAIVDGVTKLDRIQFDSKEAQQAATMRKMLVAMAKDMRVLIIKLADRLHNMRTIAAMPREKQERIAQETLDIYAPLAHRLGMQEIKQQLEDLAFASLHPKRYAEIEHMVASRSPEREHLPGQVLAEVRERLARAAHRRRGHRPRRSTCGASTRRWS